MVQYLHVFPDMKKALEEGGEGDQREEVGMIEWWSGWQRVGGAAGVKDIGTMLGEDKSAKLMPLLLLIFVAVYHVLWVVLGHPGQIKLFNYSLLVVALFSRIIAI